MDCYIIAIGGTGSRVMRAVTHLMAAGVFRQIKGLSDTHFLIVDSDDNNGDKKRAEQTITNYNEIYNAGIVTKKLVKPFPSEPNRFAWSPLTETTPMNTIEKYRDMESEVKDIYEFLYTEEERTKALEGGFYTHISIGSYYMTRGIVDDDNNYVNDWNNFFSNIKATDKIIVICSMFGGTGASGVPTLARKIHEVKATSRCDIAGVFVEPYFDAVDNQNGNDEDRFVNTKTFSAKSKMALEYYHNQHFADDVFKKMYFVGEDIDKLMKVEYNDDKEKQKNKANVMELYAATAIIDFLSKFNKQGNEAITDTDKIKISWRGVDGHDTVEENDCIFTPKLINTAGGIDVFDRLARFLKFSVLYTKFLYHCIVEDDKKQCKFLKYYNFDRSKESAEKLFEYCKRYMEWMREMVTEARPDGKFDESYLNDRDSQTNKYTKWFAREHYELYDSNFVGGNTYAKKCGNLDKVITTTEPGFTRMIHGKKRKAPDGQIISAEYIFKKLCNEPLKNTGDLNKFVEDVLTLIETGLFPEELKGEKR